MADDRYTALTSGLRRSTGTHSLVNTRTFRNTVLELPNNMELGAFIREWINENPENGLNIKYLNTNKK